VSHAGVMAVMAVMGVMAGMEIMRVIPLIVVMPFMYVIHESIPALPPSILYKKSADSASRSIRLDEFGE
jgi:hypothetical protein